MDEIINYVTLCKDLDERLVEKPVFEEIDDYTDKEETNNEIKNYGFYLMYRKVSGQRYRLR